MVLAVIAIAVAASSTSTASAETIHGLVYADENGDGKPSAGEPGIPHAVVAFGVRKFVETDASGQFDLPVPDDPQGLVWVRVPDGFAPGPVWKTELALHLMSNTALTGATYDVDGGQQLIV